MAFKDSTDEKFQDQINGSKLNLIQFSASWCGPCQQLKPIIEKISNNMADKIDCYYHDIESQPNEPTKYSVRGVPTVLLFKEKKFDLAKFKFEQDIVFNPKNENSYLYLAKIYKFKKNDDLEETNLKTVILLNPKNEEAILNLTFLKIRKSNYSESKKLIKTFKKICKNLCEQSSNLQNQLDNILLN